MKTKAELYTEYLEQDHHLRIGICLLYPDNNHFVISSGFSNELRFSDPEIAFNYFCKINNML